MAGGQPGQAQNLLNILGQQNSTGGFNTQSGYNNYAAPNQPSQMQYPQQGQPNAPFPQIVPDQQGQQNMAPMQAPQDPQQVDGGNTPPIPQQQGNKPISMSQFRQPQGLQIGPNPNATLMQSYPQQR